MKITSNQLLSALIKRLTRVSLVNEGENLILEEETNHDRTGKPVVCRDTSHAQRASQTRFFHESTNFIVGDETNHDRTGKPVVCRQRGAEQFVFGDDETESDMSLGSRSFLEWVNDQVRKKQKRSSMNVTEDGEKHGGCSCLQHWNHWNHL